MPGFQPLQTSTTSGHAACRASAAPGTRCCPASRRTRTSGCRCRTPPRSESSARSGRSLRTAETLADIPGRNLLPTFCTRATTRALRVSGIDHRFDDRDLSAQGSPPNAVLDTVTAASSFKRARKRSGAEKIDPDLVDVGKLGDRLPLPEKRPDAHPPRTDDAVERSDDSRLLETCPSNREICIGHLQCGRSIVQILRRTCPLVDHRSSPGHTWPCSAHEGPPRAQARPRAANRPAARSASRDG